MRFFGVSIGSGRAKIDPRNVLLTGVPRSGTTLTCYLLNRLPETVALHEPMNVAALADCPNAKAQCDRIDLFLRRTRRTIRWRGMAISKHVDGAVPDNPVTARRDGTGKRPLRVQSGRIRIDKPFSARGLLAVKHPAAFTAIVDILPARFRTYAIIRNPIAVLGSWNSVPFSHRHGHVPAAERLSAALRDRLAAIEDDDRRQLALLSWFYQQYRQYLAPDQIIRYEDIVASRGAALAVIHPAAEQLGVTLEDHNVHNVYDPKVMRQLGDSLLASEGGYWDFYSRANVEKLLEHCDSAAPP